MRNGDVELGCIPVENSLAGTIHKNYDLLVSHDLHIVGEVTIPISHCLMANRGVKLEDVKVVLSHPVALAQCETFIKKQGLQKEVTYDTAGSAEMVMKSGARDRAAIAGKTAALRYNLDVLVTGVSALLLVSCQSASSHLTQPLLARCRCRTSRTTSRASSS